MLALAPSSSQLLTRLPRRLLALSCSKMCLEQILLWPPQGLTIRTLRTRARSGPRGFRQHEQSIISPIRHDLKNIENARKASEQHDSADSPESTALVKLPSDDTGVLDCSPNAAARTLVSQPALVVCRQIEMMNVFIGFEEANKYVVYNGAGETVAYIAEDSHTLTSTMTRNLAGTHRAFSCHVMDPSGKVVLKIKRGFAWINSHIQVFHVEDDNSEVLIGETRQVWSLLRRKYDLFLHRNGTMVQFGAIDEPTLSWDFSVMSEDRKLLGSINRNMRGLVKEIFTDTGHYVLRMDAVDPKSTNLTTSALVSQGENSEAQAAIANTQTRALVEIEKQPMRLDERAVLLAAAVSIDFDYFSKLSGAGHGGIMPMPFFFPMGSPAGAPESTPGALPESEIPGSAADNGLGPEISSENPGNEVNQNTGDRPWWEEQAPEQQVNEANWWDQEPSTGDSDGGNWFDGFDSE